MTTCCLGSLLLELGLSSEAGEKMSGEEETRTILEFQTKVYEDFIIIVEGPGRGLLGDCKIFANLRLKL